MWIVSTLKQWQRSRRNWLDFGFNSLQLRLTVGVTLVSMVGIGSVAGLTIWRMQHILVSSRKADVQEMADRVAQDADLYRDMMPTAAAIQRSLDNRTTADLVLWVSQSGQVTAQSDMLTMSTWQRDGLATQLLTRSVQQQFRPGVERLGDRTLILCAQPLIVAGQAQGMLYIADDITLEHRSLVSLSRMLSLVGGLGWMLMAIAITIYIRRSLRPLRRMSQQAGQICAQDLGQATLAVAAAPMEVQALAQAFNQMLQRLAIAWTQQRQFVCDVSHELRTPLTLVHGYLQSTLRRSPNLSDRQREGLEIAAAEAARTVQVLQDLLDLARVDGGQVRLHVESVNLFHWAKDVVKTHPQFCDRVRVQTTVEAGADLTVPTDVTRLTQVLVNLLDNAVKYSAPDTPVDLLLTAESQQVRLEVRDQGKGIPAAAQPHLFEPFYRVEADRCRLSGGTGLGLSIVNKLTRRLGGTVSVVSAIGEGSTFTILLPRQPPPDVLANLAL